MASLLTKSPICILLNDENNKSDVRQTEDTPKEVTSLRQTKDKIEVNTDPSLQ